VDEEKGMDGIDELEVAAIVFVGAEEFVVCDVLCEDGSHFEEFPLLLEGEGAVAAENYTVSEQYAV
jgi:hypothetical protein